jgi:hypothetical protein
LWLISFNMGYFFGEYYTDNESYGFHVNGLPALVLFFTSNVPSIFHYYIAMAGDKRTDLFKLT